MVVTVKIDGRLVLLTSIYVSIGIAALLLAFPSASVWLPSNSSEMASWVQAIGGIAAIFFAGRYVAKQIAHADTQQRRVQTEAELASVWGCIFAARDAYAALIDLSRKLSGTKDRPPSSSIERIEGLEDSIRTLLGSNPHPAAVVSLLTILAELAYSRVAIRECEIEKDREAQALKADARTRKVRKALENLTALYKFLEKSQGA